MHSIQADSNYLLGSGIQQEHRKKEKALPQQNSLFDPAFKQKFRKEGCANLVMEHSIEGLAHLIHSL